MLNFILDLFLGHIFDDAKKEREVRKKKKKLLLEKQKEEEHHKKHNTYYRKVLKAETISQLREINNKLYIELLKNTYNKDIMYALDKSRKKMKEIYEKSEDTKSDRKDWY